MTDEENIKSFCSSLNVDFLDKLSVSAKDFFIDKSYLCLFQKYGKIKIVLEHYNEIKTVAVS
jgi:dihydroorotase